uniref:Tetratricopeptide repeat protein n=1 Tax=Schlesneria paludicola TaxID=360056 RepID=A0A7C4QRU0_9PLAN
MGAQTTSRPRHQAGQQIDPLRFQRWRLLLLCAALVLLAGAAWGPVCRWRAIALLSSRDYEAADVWLTRASAFGTSGAQLFWQARLSRKLLQAERAIGELRAAEARGFDRERIRREFLLLTAESGRLESVREELQKWLLEPDVDGAELCEAFARGLIMHALAPEAQAVVEAWKNEYPHDPQPYVVWGRWLESERLVAQAEVEYAEALKRKPRFAPALYALGRVHLNRTNPQQARTYFEQAAESLDAQAAPLISVAQCTLELGDPRGARAILEQVLQQPQSAIDRSFALVQDPDPLLPAERLLGKILTGLGEFAAALPHLERALEREPRDQSLRYLRAQCLQHLGRLDEARTVLQQIAVDREAIAEADRLVDEIRKQPYEPQVELRFRVGELFWKHDSTRKAEYWLRSTLSYAPDHTAAHRLLAEYYAHRSRYDPTAQEAADFHRRRARERERQPDPSLKP